MDSTSSIVAKSGYDIPQSQQAGIDSDSFLCTIAFCIGPFELRGKGREHE
jgi:hypothetical protein